MLTIWGCSKECICNICYSRKAKFNINQLNEETFTSALNMNVMVTKLFAMEKVYIIYQWLDRFGSQVLKERKKSLF